MEKRTRKRYSAIQKRKSLILPTTVYIREAGNDGVRQVEAIASSAMSGADQVTYDHKKPTKKVLKEDPTAAKKKRGY